MFSARHSSCPGRAQGRALYSRHKELGAPGAEKKPEGLEWSGGKEEEAEMWLEKEAEARSCKALSK